RMIEAVDHVQHRRLAGAVRTDDGADLALADIEGDFGQRLDAAEGERNVFRGEQHFAGGGVGGRMGPHAAFPISAASAAGGCVCMSTIFTRPAIVPLRPSSNVTSVEISTSVAPL